MVALPRARAFRGVFDGQGFDGLLADPSRGRVQEPFVALPRVVALPCVRSSLGSISGASIRPGSSGSVNASLLLPLFVLSRKG